MFLLTDERPAFGPKAMFSAPVGVASPLWGYFAGVTFAGLAFWSFTRWARPDNLEAFFAAARPGTGPIAPQPIAALALVAPTGPEVVAAVEAFAEAVTEAVPTSVEPVEALAETVVEPAVVEPAVVEPVVVAPPARRTSRRSSEPRPGTPETPPKALS